MLALGFSVLNPMSIPAIYLLLSNFFIVDLPPSILNTSKIYALGIFIYFLFYLPNGWQRARKYWPYILGIFSAIFIPSLMHYLYWKQLPLLFTIPMLKGLWGLGFLLLPKEKISWTKLFRYLFYALIATLVLITPESISYFYSKGAGLGRTLVASNTKHLLAGFGKQFWFVMDDNTYENMSIMSIPLILAFWHDLALCLWKRFVPICILFFYYLFVLYINQYFMPFVLLGINSVIGLIWIIKFKVKTVAKIPLITVFMCISALTLYIEKKSDFSKRFIIQEKTLAATNIQEKLDQSNRISLFMHTFLNIEAHDIFFGVGMPKDYEKPVTPRVGGENILTHHSTLVDTIVSLGFLAGPLANFIFFIPLFLYLIPTVRRNLGIDCKIAFFLLFSTVLLLSFETIFGRESLQLGVTMAFSSIFFLSWKTIKKY